ncbi:MAG: Sapep family Mn(2+)-dependent dipeptidase [Firmicutes bacterium]|nr:Sapep family Mn(2+)-dependent dipeptidase [[Eubacterium] siraeum]MCM1487051.1 Sapep family Mn(2+)-dependent dipeptidase [Bacillota bacterium]
MEIRKYLENNFDRLKQDLARLIRIPSVSVEKDGEYPFGRECGRALEEFLQLAEEKGFYVKNYDHYAGSADLFPEGEPELGILAHLDVVPVSEKDWTMPPFQLTEKDGKLYGRGSIDDKGPLLAALYAMLAVRECGYKLRGNVRLIAGCSEETGSEIDIGEYMKRAKMPKAVFTPDAEFPIITTEKGMLRFTFGGTSDSDRILSIKGGTVVNAVPAEVTAVLKGKAELPQNEYIGVRYEGDDTVITCKGVSAHASTPEHGKNAFTRLLTYLSPLVSGKDKALTDGLLKLFPENGFDGSSLGLAVRDRSGSTTCVFSIIDFENGRLTAKADMRFPVSLTKAKCTEKIKAAVETAGFKLLDITGSEPHCTDNDSPFVKALLKAYTEVTGKEGFCKAIGGGTYVHGIEGGVAFGMETEGENNNMHGDDEWVGKTNLLTAAEIYAKAILEVVGE